MKTEKFEINKVNEDDKMDKELNELKDNPNLPQSVLQTGKPYPTTIRGPIL